MAPASPALRALLWLESCSSGFTSLQCVCPSFAEHFQVAWSLCIPKLLLFVWWEQRRDFLLLNTLPLSDQESNLLVCHLTWTSQDITSSRPVPRQGAFLVCFLTLIFITMTKNNSGKSRFICLPFYSSSRREAELELDQEQQITAPPLEIAQLSCAGLPAQSW